MLMKRSTVVVVAFGLSSLGATALPGRMDEPVAGRALMAPSVLKNISSVPHVVEVNISAAPARMSLQPGVTTDVFAYNGQIPGPTLDVSEGDSVIIHFQNKLSEPTTVHWHGLHIPAEQDGSPFNPLAPGEKHDYVFVIKRGTAGTYWYHPHPDMRSGYQVAKGLYGGIIIRAADDPLPKSMTEKLIVLGDNRFLPDGSLDFPALRSPQGIVDENNGREGPVIFVNGQIMPTITIRPALCSRSSNARSMSRPLMPPSR